MKPRVSQLLQTGATNGQVPTWNGTEWAPASPAASTKHFLLPYSHAGTLAPTTGTFRLYAERAMTITQVRASVGTAPTGAALVVDVNKNGTTVFTTQSNRPSIAAGSNTATATAINVTSLAAGDYLTVDIDAVGSTVAGADLTVTVEVAE